MHSLMTSGNVKFAAADVNIALASQIKNICAFSEENQLNAANIAVKGPSVNITE